MNTYAIDFETYYDADVTVETLGPWLYHQHPDTRAYLVSVAGDDGYRYAGPPEGCDWARQAGGVWVSHNAPFDQCAYLRLGTPGGGPAEWHCTANLAAYLQAPRSLAGAARELLGVVVDKSARDRMKGVRWADLNPIGQQEMYEYGRRDAELCLKLWLQYRTEWPDAERELSAHTGRMMMAGLPVDEGVVAAGVAALDNALAEARAGIPWAGAPLSKKELAVYCEAEGIPCPDSMAKDDEDFAVWCERYADGHPVVKAMRDWRRINSLREKVGTLHRQAQAGLYHGGLKYFGAQHTGRWSGDNGFNVQNLPREEMWGVDLRKCFRAPAGHTFVIVDLSQIEPRVLHYLAGDTEMLDKLRDGWNIYEAFAAGLGWAFERGTLKANKAAYGAAKAGELGAGYGAGAETFCRMAPVLSGGAYRPTPAESKRAIDEYRRKNPGIVGLWRQMDAALRENVGGELAVTLPSGRVIRYFDLQADRRGVSGLTVRGDKRRKNLYGALVVENIVQATARDIFATGLLNMHYAGVDVRLHVHDEAVALCRTVEAEAVSARMIDLMTTPPEWMPDIPLAAEATISEVYCK